MEKRTIVISAVNIVEGGAMTILQDCLSCLAKSELSSRYEIIAVINSKHLLPKYDNIYYIECPKAKKHYLYRFYYEYLAFRRMSKRINPVLWLSLHDMSPRVKADIQAVYMHNPSPFYNPSKLAWRFIPITAIWAYLYKYIYRINIHANKYLIVQQDWLRTEFSRMFKLNKNRIVVARPVNNDKQAEGFISKKTGNSVYQFVYPAYPRVFKNFEVICEAAKILENDGVTNMKIVLTVDGSENKYSKYLLDSYGNIGLISFVGLVDKSKMKELYDNSDCLIFPSKLETWGLPLSEFKPYGRPILAADLPYAHESVAGADKVLFFNPDDASYLANAMKELAGGDEGHMKEAKELDLNQPLCSSWESLFEILLG